MRKSWIAFFTLCCFAVLLAGCREKKQKDMVVETQEEEFTPTPEEKVELSEDALKEYQKLAYVEECFNTASKYFTMWFEMYDKNDEWDEYLYGKAVDTMVMAKNGFADVIVCAEIKDYYEYLRKQIDAADQLQNIASRKQEVIGPTAVMNFKEELREGCAQFRLNALDDFYEHNIKKYTEQD